MSLPMGHDYIIEFWSYFCSFLEKTKTLENHFNHEPIFANCDNQKSGFFQQNTFLLLKKCLTKQPPKWGDLRRMKKQPSKTILRDSQVCLGLSCFDVFFVEKKSNLRGSEYKKKTTAMSEAHFPPQMLHLAKITTEFDQNFLGNESKAFPKKTTTFGGKSNNRTSILHNSG